MSAVTDHPTVELTSEQRMRWGTCPVCKAEHGHPCNNMVGFPLGMNVDGGRPIMEGAHLGRLMRAPRNVPRPGAVVAKDYGIFQTMVSRIRRGQAWREPSNLPPVQVIPTPVKPTAPLERAITSDYLMRRQGVELPSRFPAEFWNRRAA